jgi:acetyl-CoA carboxylase, biotin carboxylase subunit
MLRDVLIANRGEIALRVVRACRELGIHSIVAHSTPDGDSAAVRVADRAVRIGPAPARRSYLNAAAILEAALQTGADAIHPGYGFLSEDPDFAHACEQNGIVLIGPPADVMARLASKISARALMASTGLPLLPGSIEPMDDVDEARALAAEIGFPVIIKASAGGGGRGMTVIRDPKCFDDGWRRTRAGAQLLFGDRRVYVEKYLDGARHVEIQIFADSYGTAVHLGARDCSVQRRHQKLVEETPPPRVADDLVPRMGAAAVRGALAAGYVGAGTFEFLLDKDGRFYFMETNCRIQVEHPVTEAVTGIDLVRAQLVVAGGDPLPFRQEDVDPRGVAIECRINAEDPDRDFTPTPGAVNEFVPPGGPFVRVDTAAFPGSVVPPNYDSLLAKVIVWAPDRDQALARMARSLEEFRISGPRLATTRDFLRRVIDHPAFRAARHDVRLVDEVVASGSRSADLPVAGGMSGAGPAIEQRLA